MSLLIKWFSLLLMCAWLFASAAFAFTLPLIENRSSFELQFDDVSYQEKLTPLITEQLTRYRSDAEKSTIETSRSKQAKAEQEVITKLLRSEGFYGAKVTHSIEDEVVTYHLVTQDPYYISETYLESDLKNVPEIASFGIKKGDIFKAKALIHAINEVKVYLEEHHCLWQINVTYDARVDHARKTASVRLIIAPSDEVVFGAMTLSGLTSVDSSYLKPKLGIQEGTCFKRSKVEKARLNLFKTNLIRSVNDVKHKQGKNVDIVFELAEKDHRTIKAGAGVSSDEGFSISGGWEHRNFMGRAQKLEVNTRLSELLRVIDANLTVPAFLRTDQQLVVEGEISQEYFEAFEATSIGASVGIKRKLSKHLTASAGSRVDITHVKNSQDDESFGLVSFPFGVDYDTRENILNEKNGYLLSGKFSPYVNAFDANIVFFKTSIGGSAYYTPSDVVLTPTFAVRTALGSISGQNTDDIPADERFYTGGGGSVRGYAFQKLGPLDGDDPTGGRSFSEVSFESRLNFSKEWGGVLFVDGGNTYEDVLPDFEEDIRWAYGMGVRYYTDFAPIRFDIAFPIEPRYGIDDKFQFYVGIGQAF